MAIECDQIRDNQISWKGERPWHGKGVNVTKDATGAEMLIAASLNWRVQRRNLSMRDGMGIKALTEPLANFRAIVREDTDEVFQVAMAGYTPHQNEDIIDTFRAFCEAGKASIEVVGGLQGGRKIWALARLANDMLVSAGDAVSPFLLLASSHDGSISTVGKPTAVRVVCRNTWNAALYNDGGKRKNNEYRLSHRTAFNMKEKERAQRVMGMALEATQESVEMAKGFTRVALDRQGIIEYVKAVLGLDKKQQSVEGLSIIEQIALEEDVVSEGVAALEGRDSDGLNRMGRWIIESILDSPGSDLPGAEGTLWGAMNGFTHYVDHRRGRNPDSGLAGAWFGPGDALKTRAFEVAQNFATAGGRG